MGLTVEFEPSPTVAAVKPALALTVKLLNVSPPRSHPAAPSRVTSETLMQLMALSAWRGHRPANYEDGEGEEGGFLHMKKPPSIPKRFSWIQDLQRKATEMPECCRGNPGDDQAQWGIFGEKGPDRQAFLPARVGGFYRPCPASPAIREIK